MEKYKSLGVFCDGEQAGTLALYQNRLCAFDEAKAKDIAEEIRTVVHEMLEEYLGNTYTHEY